MPGGDGTGPDGRGGWCTPIWSGGQIQRPVGRGFSRGGGRGRGFAAGRASFARPTWSREETLPSEKEYIEQEVELLKKQLDEAKSRLKDLEDKK
jgi:hypothetical protein